MFHFCLEEDLRKRFVASVNFTEAILGSKFIYPNVTAFAHVTQKLWITTAFETNITKCIPNKLWNLLKFRESLETFWEVHRQNSLRSETHSRPISLAKRSLRLKLKKSKSNYSPIHVLLSFLLFDHEYPHSSLNTAANNLGEYFKIFLSSMNKYSSKSSAREGRSGVPQLLYLVSCSGIWKLLRLKLPNLTENPVQYTDWRDGRNILALFPGKQDWLL